MEQHSSRSGWMTWPVLEGKTDSQTAQLDPLVCTTVTTKKMPVSSVLQSVSCCTLQFVSVISQQVLNFTSVADWF